MIHRHPGWLGSRLKIIVNIVNNNIFVKVYGEKLGKTPGLGETTCESGKKETQ